ncbi:hypothetical protein LTR37_019807 [Vermiconidia calcicola]|uniref:Uncharacterized protein n=1 Tax=Vermiconidia calcicola TaxID=1690605 RepID=A0ACC3MEY4_9PEZI|nr:hypothetical protein LTR37_019807 [Vermiconidia calcicola]
MSATAEDTRPSPRRKPRKLRIGGASASVDLGRMSSPVNTEQQQQHNHHDNQNHEENEEEQARESFDQEDSDLDDLPIDEHSYLNNEPSFTQQQQQQRSDDDAGDRFDEREMRRHFMDVESSFLPEQPAQYEQQRPQQEEGRLGVDDTYLELGKPGHTPPPDEMFANLSGRRSQSRHLHQVSSRGSGRSEVDEALNEDDGELEEDVEESCRQEENTGTASSPAAAAARRGHGRTVSTASATKITPVHARKISIGSGGASQQQDSRPSTPGTQRPTSKGSTIRPDSSPQQQPEPKTMSVDKTRINNAFVPIRQSSARSIPKISGQSSARSMFKTNGRQLSTNSFASSTTLDSDLSGSEATSNDFLGVSSRRQPLDRLLSFGSVASYMTDGEGAPPLHRGVSSTSVLAGMRSGRFDGNEDDDRPETPRGNTTNFKAPTDTVIAQHVQSIEVPETIARDFRAKNRSLSPDKQRPASSGVVQGATTFQGVPRRTLTLKEQNSKIDKLTKENFDLKLKIHFLDQALQSRSEEGVKELIDKNVQFQTDLANERKDSQGLKRRVRELERQMQEQAEAFAQAQAQQQEQQQKNQRDAEEDDDPTLQAEMHEEILYLRQQLDHSENKVTTLTEDVMTKELEKRKMAEHMRSMAGTRGEDTAGMKETMDMWQDLLNAETGRREQAEEDIRKLREELTTLRIERASPAPNRIAQRRGKGGYEESVGGESEYTNGVNISPVESGSTLVDHLKHENAELRRDLGAQTSMLTSRNRERERLQQEIEDLKLLQRKSDGGARSVAGDSIFDRSISRAHHHRAPSRASEAGTHITEAEREDWDKKEGQLRDQNAELRLKFQELERTHNTHLQYVSVLEGDFQQMENELNEASEDLKALQIERDEALQAFEDKDGELEKLEQEALAEIDKLEKEVESLQGQLEDSHKKQHKLQNKLEHTTDGYKGLQGELREITQSVMNLEDEKQANIRTIQTLEQQLADTEDELQKWEQKCKEIDQKNRKLEITQESLHSEITFLRDEQEGDKIKIGELEDALNAAQQTIQDEQEKLRELEEGIQDERQQRDVLENKSKEEVQTVLDDLNNENQKTKDEVRKLRRGLSAKEVEANGFKQRLEELEQSLRTIIGDPEGTKQSLLADVEKLQRDLEMTANSLDRVKMDLADKDRLLRHRDGLLESTSLESRRLSDLLDKERASRRHDLEQFEKSHRGQATHMRTLAQQESRMLEMESAFTQDKRRMAALEQQYRDQLGERNNLLLALWNRLSTLCGAEWAQHHSLVEGEVPSLDVIARRLPGFNKNLISAVKTVEALIGNFKIRIRSIEKDLWRDYQTLEHNLDMRIRRMDNLERAVKEAQVRAAAEEAAQAQQQAQQRPPTSRAASFKSNMSMKGNEEVSKLKSEVKILKAELKFHRQHPSAMAQQMMHQQNQSQGPVRRESSSGSAASLKSNNNSPARQIVSQLLRHHSTSAVEQLQDHPPGGENHPRQQQQPIVLSTPPVQPSEQRWIHRLKELERRLKAEREARLLDRRGARQRLEEGRLENEELRQMLEHERVRREYGSAEDGESSGGGSERLEEEEEDVERERGSNGPGLYLQHWNSTEWVSVPISEVLGFPLRLLLSFKDTDPTNRFAEILGLDPDPESPTFGQYCLIPRANDEARGDAVVARSDGKELHAEHIMALVNYAVKVPQEVSALKGKTADERKSHRAALAARMLTPKAFKVYFDECKPEGMKKRPKRWEDVESPTEAGYLREIVHNRETGQMEILSGESSTAQGTGTAVA